MTCIYKTVPTTDEVHVIARRNGSDGPFRGKAFIEDVKLEKVIPSLDTKISLIRPSMQAKTR